MLHFHLMTIFVYSILMHVKWRVSACFHYIVCLYMLIYLMMLNIFSLLVFRPCTDYMSMITLHLKITEENWIIFIFFLIYYVNRVRVIKIVSFFLEHFKDIDYHNVNYANRNNNYCYIASTFLHTILWIYRGFLGGLYFWAKVSFFKYVAWKYYLPTTERY